MIFSRHYEMIKHEAAEPSLPRRPELWVARIPSRPVLLLDELRAANRFSLIELENFRCFIPCRMTACLARSLSRAL